MVLPCVNGTLKNQHARLVMQANVLNDQTNAIMLAAKLLQEYRSLTQSLIAEGNLLLDVIDHERKNSQPDGATVPSQTPPTTGPDTH